MKVLCGAQVQSRTLGHNTQLTSGSCFLFECAEQAGIFTTSLSILSLQTKQIQESLNQKRCVMRKEGLCVQKKGRKMNCIYLQEHLYNFYISLLINALEKSLFPKKKKGITCGDCSLTCHRSRPVITWDQSRSRSGSGNPPTPPCRHPACRRSSS